MPYYSVHKGKKPGIYTSWEECKKNVYGYPGAKYKKFNTLEEAKYFLKYGKELKSNDDNKKSYDKKKSYDIYTDGSLIKKNGESYAGYGFYIPSLNIKKSYPLKGKKTNNRAELSAIIKAIKLFKEKKDEVRLNIYTDSGYSILIFTSTGKKYKAKNYKDVINSDLVEKAVKLSEKYDLKFIHVRSHTGLKDVHSLNNEIADKLAVEGSNKYYYKSN